MSTLPPLDQATQINLSREGGVAFLPGQRNSCSIALGSCSEDERARIRQALLSAAPKAQAADEAGRGDQRYFVILINFNDDAATEDVRLHVGEQEAPEELIRLWRERTGRR
ncbi:protealysin inhibitor emfourin [Pseudomonas matsuisoli]|uniref:Uncharacterized protein n=1 Tax=Pseudomonas matsuisoli TaxID=1515666 RepID=A0A917UWD3_9PSED|nr:protealysin inhibitor emfourin [Pseudomonas matsuisoli]GGJ90257.1 hypothetical protein GCM10009304_14850 [Pseudomonas matsuisoli]